MLSITEAQVRELLSMPKAVELMRGVFSSLARGEAINQPRRRLILPTGSVLHSLAGAYGKYFGTKIYSTNPGHGAHFFFLLFDAETARPLATIEANYLGQIRTGAASGMVTDLLASKGHAVLGIIGSGFQAHSQLEAMRAVRDLSEVRVWSRDASKRIAFAQANQVTAVDTAEQAVRGANIVVTATNSKEPVLEASWISPGTHVNAMGSNTATRRELPAELIAKADLIVVDSLEQAKIEAGDLLLAWKAGDWTKAAEVQTLFANPHPYSPEKITVFKSLGIGVEDVAAAAFVYETILASKL